MISFLTRPDENEPKMWSATKNCPRLFERENINVPYTKPSTISAKWFVKSLLDDFLNSLKFRVRNWSEA